MLVKLNCAHRLPSIWPKTAPMRRFGSILRPIFPLDGFTKFWKTAIAAIPKLKKSCDEFASILVTIPTNWLKWSTNLSKISGNITKRSYSLSTRCQHCGSCSMVNIGDWAPLRWRNWQIICVNCLLNAEWSCWLWTSQRVMLHSIRVSVKEEQWKCMQTFIYWFLLFFEKWTIWRTFCWKFLFCRHHWG